MSEYEVERTDRKYAPQNTTLHTNFPTKLREVGSLRSMPRDGALSLLPGDVPAHVRELMTGGGVRARAGTTYEQPGPCGR